MVAPHPGCGGPIVDLYSLIKNYFNDFGGTDDVSSSNQLVVIIYKMNFSKLLPCVLRSAPEVPFL